MTATRRQGRTIVLLAALCAAGFAPLHATSFYWDANGDTAGTGGAGTWDTSSALWRNGSATGTLQTWPNTDPGNPDKAVLAGTAGTVSLNGDSQNISVNAINFGANYTIGAPSAGTAVLNLSGTAPTVEGSATGARINAVIAGGSLTKTSTGKLALMGNNTYAGGTFHSAGQLIVGHVNALGTGTLNLNGGSLGAYTGFAGAPTNAVVVNNNVTLGNYSGLPGDASFGNALTLSGPVTLTGSRTVTVSILGLGLTGVISDGGSGHGLTYNSGSYANTFTLGGANAFGGGVTFNGNANGTLRLSNMGALGTGTLTINGTGGKIDNGTAADGTISPSVAQVWNGDFTYPNTARSLNMGTGAVSLGTAAGTNRSVTVTSSARTLAVGGVISDGTTATYLTKAGAGTLALGGANLYSGGTVVSAGTLSVTVGGALGSGNVRVANGATLALKDGTAIGDEATLELVKVGTAYGKVDLAAGVRENVGKVILGGVVYTQPGQTFGSTTSGASLQNNDYFAGAGVVRIATSPGTVVLVR